MLNDIIAVVAKDLIYLLVAAFAVFLMLTPRKVRARLTIISVIALPLAYILGKISSYFWYDTRPFVESGVAPLITHAADNGFPSDHMLLAATLASIVTLRYPRTSIVFWLMAILIGVSRVLAHVHHPIDIIASSVFGIASAFVAYELIILRPMRSHMEIAQPR